MRWKTNYLSAGLGTALLVFAAGCGSEAPQPDTGETVDPPIIESFEGEPASVTSGTDVHGDEVQGEVHLQWDVEDAAAVALFANEDPVELGDCELTGEADEEAADCLPGATFTHHPEEATTYRLDAVNHADAECEFDGDEIDNPTVCDSATFEVDVKPPALLALDRATDRFETDEEFFVEYSVEHAEDWEIGIVIDGELEICEVDSSEARCSLSEDNSGELTLRDIDESITLSGWATNGADDGQGDIEVGDVTLDLFPMGTPIVRSLSATPTHVAFGESTELSWQTEDAVDVEITSDASVFITSDLDDCGDVDGDGVGMCDVSFAEDAPDINVTFTAVAHGEEGQESSPLDVSVILGAAPAIAGFEAEPTMLPEQGGDVILSWETTNEPTRLVIIDDGAPANLILDTEDDTGTDSCHSSGDECDLVSDSLTVEDIETNTQFTLIASSPLGSDSSSVTISIEGAPQITALTVDGTDVSSDSVTVDADSANLEWDTEDTDETELERAAVPEEGCSSPDVDWNEISDFPGQPSGDYEVADLDMVEQCFRLTARGEADQRATATFHIARHPFIADFSADPETIHRGGEVELTWDAPFADEVSLSVSPAGSVSSADRDGCTDVDAADFMGSCVVTIQPGSPQGNVEFTLDASGFDEAEADSAITTITVGEAPTANHFESDPSTATDAVQDVTLSWMTSDGVDVEITDDQGQVHFTDDSGEVADGEFVVSDVDQTTTWTLVVSNQFGSDSENSTTFFGPSVDTFEVNGQDGLGGEVEVTTGDVDFVWTTTSADDADFERADAPGNIDCDDANNWELLGSYSGGDGSFFEDDVVENGCYRLSLSNEAGQASSIGVFVVEVPYITSMTTNVDSINGANGGTVTIDMAFVGVSGLTLTALYYDENDVQIDDTEVCTENTLNTGALNGGVEEDEVGCVHSMNGECGGGLGCIGVADDPGSDTAYIVYEVEYSDVEGDGDTAVTDEDEHVLVE